MIGNLDHHFAEWSTRQMLVGLLGFVECIDLVDDMLDAVLVEERVIRSNEVRGATAMPEWWSGGRSRAPAACRATGTRRSSRIIDHVV
ncbi:hypothetical protein [Pseudoduganella umbonata]|uniref:Uncharacterized protein n=1 Tax=Pseudoduganella umbonata TaxID=864828 RepID=A0A7W5HG15_9BURK|nr:hypothetical protein [Pseudoduganella umbonata]MBB3225208.1 hypothetical protein [Pseudoduganella umbonata]